MVVSHHYIMPAVPCVAVVTIDNKKPLRKARFLKGLLKSGFINS